MGISKKDKFTTEQNQIAAVAKVLGHPARVAILQHLFKLEGCYCGDLVTEIGLAQATISQHLKELKKVGLIKGNIEGTSICYCIDKNSWQEMNQLMQVFLNQHLNVAECCN